MNPVNVWLLNTEKLSEKELSEMERNLLPERRILCQKKKTGKGWKESVASGWLLTQYRELLQKNNKKTEIQLCFEEKGKPYWDVQKEIKDGYFSLSHSSGMVGIAFASASIGFDLEPVKEVRKSIADRFFTEEEKKQDFFEVWTRKEALAKRLGMGLSVPLKELHVSGEGFYTFYRQEEEKRYCFSLSLDREITGILVKFPFCDYNNK